MYEHLRVSTQICTHRCAHVHVLMPHVCLQLCQFDATSAKGPLIHNIKLNDQSMKSAREMDWPAKCVPMSCVFYVLCVLCCVCVCVCARVCARECVISYTSLCAVNRLKMV